MEIDNLKELWKVIKVILIITFILAVIGLGWIFFIETKELIAGIKGLKEDWALYLILLSVVVYSFLYLNRKRHYRIFKEEEKRIEMEEAIDRQISYIKEFLSKDLEKFDSKSLKELIEEVTGRRYYGESKEPFEEQFDKKVKKAKRLIIEKRHEEKLERTLARQWEAKKELEEIERKIWLKQLSENDDKRIIKKKLNIWENEVFEKNKLTKKQIEILLEGEYKQINEYCVVEKKMISVLVRKISNHSRTHVFLVWSIKKILKNIGGITNIREHYTKDADITFKFNNRYHALEIETGSLIGKKKQSEEKVNYLNNKYNKRWMFIVSNRNLVSKYKKFGLTTQRKDLEKSLQKLLKINTRLF